MAKSTKVKTFQVHMRCTDVLLAGSVQAVTLEEALEKARGQNYNDVFAEGGLEWIDGTPEITGLFT